MEDFLAALVLVTFVVMTAPVVKLDKYTVAKILQLGKRSHS